MWDGKQALSLAPLCPLGSPVLPMLLAPAEHTQRALGRQALAIIPALTELGSHGSGRQPEGKESPVLPGGDRVVRLKEWAHSEPPRTVGWVEVEGWGRLLQTETIPGWC